MPVTKPWRLIPPMVAEGFFQMALDEWLLDQHRQGDLPSVLRFYTWSRTTISLGYHQRQIPQHWRSLSWQGAPLELVRRPTGGRAVLHQGDLTYAVVTSGLPGRRGENYQTLCQFLIQGWRSLGVELTYGHAGRGYIHNPNCFGSATGADLRVGDAKLIGSAQRYQGDAVLQHGAILLQPDPELFEQVFGVPLIPPLTQAHLPQFSQDQVLMALEQAAIATFGGTWQVQPLSSAELQQVQALAIQRQTEFPEFAGRNFTG